MKRLRTIDELKTMSKEQIMEDFEQNNCNKSEVIDLLNSIDIEVVSMSKRSIFKFAATQISLLGIYERIVNKEAQL